MKGTCPPFPLTADCRLTLMVLKSSFLWHLYLRLMSWYFLYHEISHSQGEGNTFPWIQVELEFLPFSFKFGLLDFFLLWFLFLKKSDWLGSLWEILTRKRFNKWRSNLSFNQNGDSSKHVSPPRPFRITSLCSICNALIMMSLVQNDYKQ